MIPAIEKNDTTRSVTAIMDRSSGVTSEWASSIASTVPSRLLLVVVDSGSRCCCRNSLDRGDSYCMVFRPAPAMLALSSVTTDISESSSTWIPPRERGWMGEELPHKGEENHRIYRIVLHARPTRPVQVFHEDSRTAGQPKAGQTSACSRKR